MTTDTGSLSAAELIAIRARLRLQTRLAWLAEGDGVDDVHEERAWLARQDLREVDAVDRRLNGPEGAAWTRLASTFALPRAEQELLQLALAVAIEPALGPVVAAAQGAEGRLLPTEALVKRLADLPIRPIWRPTAKIAMWGLLASVRSAPGEPMAFEADPRIADWMFGVTSLDRSLVLAVAPADETAPPAEWPIEAAAERVARMLAAGQETRLLVEARPGSGRRRFGAAVVRRLGGQPLIADPAALTPGNWAEDFMRAQRFALFAGATLIWREGAPAWPGKLATAPLQVVCVDEGTTAPARDGATDIRIALPEPSVPSKAAAWRRLAPQLASEDDGKIASIPGLSLSDLEAAARTAPASVEDVTAQLRALSRARLEGVGHGLDPRFGWEDLVLPSAVEQALRRIAFEARTRASILADPEARRLLAGASSLSALFAGPSGVGKSMAAQVIARDLGVNLLVVDLAALTSKYVGETAKNLSQAFAQARSAGAALIFEEADAIFARRTEIKDANDRHANADTSHLLHLMETHEGLVILSTNRRANIDPAFLRRLRHTVEFPRPGLDERRRIWTGALVALGADPDALEGGLEAPAARYDLSPAQIKSAALTARYAALADRDRAISADDIDAAARQELVKEGRSAPTAPTPLLRPRMPVRG
jgi:hypothetical protein